MADVSIRRIRIVALAAPVVLVFVLEIARYVLLGAIEWRERLLLDGAAAATVIIFYVLAFRYISRVHQRLHRQNLELLALHSAGLDVAAELGLDAVLKKVVDQARNLVGAKYGALSVVRVDGTIEKFVTSGISAEERARIGPPPVGHGLLGVVLRHGEHLRLTDLTKDPRTVGFPPNHPMMRSLLAVPVICKGPFVGNLYLAEKVMRAGFTKEDEETLERFAVQAAIAIDNAHLHSQAGNLAAAEERLRIAHEMHDGLAQVLGYVNTKVQAAKEYLRTERKEEAEAQLEQLAAAAREAYVDVREGIVGLRTLPGPKRSLADALEEYMTRWREQNGIATQLTRDPELRLEPNVELQLVRIVQEALTNIRKHARATKASVDLRRAGETLVATIADNGIGFDPGARARGDFPRFGLSTMRERAESVGGRLDVKSTPGSGTTIEVTLPLSPAA